MRVATGAGSERWQNVMLYGPPWEIYGHWREDPSELETEIFWLLL